MTAKYIDSDSYKAYKYEIHVMTRLNSFFCEFKYMLSIRGTPRSVACRNKRMCVVWLCVCFLYYYSVALLENISNRNIL